MKRMIMLLLVLIPLFTHAQGIGRDLSFGLRNNAEVKILQQFLTDQKIYAGEITGNFFSMTRKAVKAFQIKQGIVPASGYVGNKTRAKINALSGPPVNTQPVAIKTESVAQSVSSPAPDIKEKIQYIVEIVCPTKSGTMSGTGTIIYGTSATDSKVITNKHVVNGATAPCGVYRTLAYENQPIPYFKSNTAFIFSKNYDLAIITPDVKTINTYPNTNLQFNEESSDIFNKNIFVLGYPASAGNNITLTKGIISGSETVNGVTLYKTDAKIDSGNSGGAVFDETGKFLGVPTLASRGNFSSYGYIIPISVIKSFLNLVEQEGYQKQNWQHPELSVYGVNPSNTVPDVSVGTPQNQVPQQEGDSVLKIARCQAETRKNIDQVLNSALSEAKPGFQKLVDDAQAQWVKVRQEQSDCILHTPPDLIGASPEQQQSVRDACFRAKQPTVDYYANLVQRQIDLWEQTKRETRNLAEQQYNSLYLKCLNQ